MFFERIRSLLWEGLMIQSPHTHMILIRQILFHQWKKIQIFSNNFMFQRVCTGTWCWILQRDHLIPIDWQVFMVLWLQNSWRNYTRLHGSASKCYKKGSLFPACTFLFWKAPLVIIPILPQTCLIFGKSFKPAYTARSCDPIGDCSFLHHRAEYESLGDTLTPQEYQCKTSWMADW